MATYQGPVPTGADKKLFRSTGQTGIVIGGDFTPYTGSSAFKKPGGGGRGNKSTSSSSSNNAQAEAQRKAQEDARKLAEKLAQERKELQAKLNKERQSKIESGKISGQLDVKVKGGGGVQIGKTTYSGNAYISELGLTANQYQDKIKREAIASGQLDVKNYGRSGFDVSYKTQTTAPNQFGESLMLNTSSPVKTTQQKSSFTSGIISGTKSFLFEKPTLEGLNKKGKIAGGFQLFGYYAFKPVSVVGEGINFVGSGIKSSGFKGSGVLGTTIGGVGGLVPQTPAGQLSLIGGVKAISVAPKIVRAGAGTYFAYSGGKSALDKNLTPEERVTGGIIGVAGASGASFELIPFARGARNVLSPSYKSVKTQPEGFKAIELENTKIGLILKKSPLKSGITKDVNLPKTSPLVRGGFGFKNPQIKKIFLGSNQIVSSSQRGLFKSGKNIPFEREFFVSPQEPNLLIPETRISRLSIEDPFSFQKNVEFGFGFPKPSQIGIERGATISRTETGGSFRIGTGTELEGIKSSGTITNIERIGRTTIKGQGVDIFEFKTSSNNILGSKTKISQPTTSVNTRVSSESVFGSTSGLILKTSNLIPKTSTSSRLTRTSYPNSLTTFTPSISKPTITTSTTTRTINPYGSSFSSSVKLPSSYYGSSAKLNKVNPQIPPQILPKLKLKIAEKTKSNLQLFKQQTRYQPSFTASALKIQSSVKPSSVSSLGIGVRPLIIKKSNGKKMKRRHVVYFSDTKKNILDLTLF